MFRTCSEHVPDGSGRPTFFNFVSGTGSAEFGISDKNGAYNGVFNFDFGQLLVFGRFSG